MEGPRWVRDELILALDVYFELDQKHMTQNNPLIVELSDLLRSLPIHKYRPDEDKFRNPSGVSMKLQNFLKYDFDYKSKGLSHGNKLESTVWDDYADNRAYLHKVAAAIRRCLPLPFEYSHVPDLDQEDFREGTILYQYHKFIESDAKRVKRLRGRAYERGAYSCSICGFNYYDMYGEIGYGFMECHHLLPVAQYSDNMAVSDGDFALVCSNCHRMLHRTKAVMDKYDLKKLLIKDSRYV